jgi:hypothetical protein
MHPTRPDVLQIPRQNKDDLCTLQEELTFSELRRMIESTRNMLPFVNIQV